MRGISKAAIAIVLIIWLIALLALVPKAPAKFKKAAPAVVLVGTLALAGLILFQGRAAAISELTEPGRPASLADMVALFQSDEQATYTAQASQAGNAAIQNAVSARQAAAAQNAVAAEKTGTSPKSVTSIEKTVGRVVADKRKDVVKAYKRWAHSPTADSRKGFSIATSTWMAARTAASALM